MVFHRLVLATFRSSGVNETSVFCSIFSRPFTRAVVSRPGMVRCEHACRRQARVATKDNISVVYTTSVLHTGITVTSQEFKRWLQKQGCSFEPGRGGHLTVRLGDRVSSLPMHGNKRDLPTGTVNAILKTLELKK